MPHYTSGRKTYWPYLLKQWLKPLAVYVIIIAYDQFFSNDIINITAGFYWIGAILVLYRLIDLLSRICVYKISIDENARTLTRYHHSLFSGKGEKIYTLSKMQLYIKGEPSSSSGILPASLALYKDHREILQLGVRKDGFTPQTLDDIRRKLEELGIPVSA